MAILRLQKENTIQLSVQQAYRYIGWLYRGCLVLFTFLCHIYCEKNLPQLWSQNKQYSLYNFMLFQAIVGFISKSEHGSALLCCCSANNFLCLIIAMCPAKHRCFWLWLGQNWHEWIVTLFYSEVTVPLSSWTLESFVDFCHFSYTRLSLYLFLCMVSFNNNRTLFHVEVW